MRSVGVALLVLLLLGCSAGPGPAGPAPHATAAATRTVRPLPVDGQLDYQIGGPYAPVEAVAVVTRDRAEPPAPGRYGVCYVNAFQTQPEDAGFWTGEHPDLVVRRDGRPVVDPDWPGEMILDTSTPAKRDALLEVVGPWIDGCATSGYDAVEPDNLDSWTRSDGVLTQADDVAFATALTLRAHASGLAVGQKNTGELGEAGRSEVGFDFAVVEECQVYDECDAYTAVYGDQVLEVEYTDNPRPAYAEACRARGDRISVVLRDRDVVPRGRPGYTYEAC